MCVIQVYKKKQTIILVKRFRLARPCKTKPLPSTSSGTGRSVALTLALEPVALEARHAVALVLG